jgi:predicted DNA-binding protein with PD1-like motif
LKIIPIERARHLLVRMHPGDVLPDTLLQQMRDRQITGGWVRASGILNDVEVRAYSAEIEGPGGTKRLTGPVQAVVIEGSIGVAGGDVSASLRVVLARETDRGLETIAGDLVKARVVGLEALVTVLEDVVLPRSLDSHSGVWLVRDDAVALGVAPSRTTPPEAPAAAVPPAPPSWSDATAGGPPVPPRPPSGPGPVPLRPLVRRVAETEEQPTPQAGDIVEHFAFGTCEVLKSDGDRLHVKMVKDSRIREIALEMLRVTALPNTGEAQRYKLDRKL